MKIIYLAGFFPEKLMQYFISNNKGIGQMPGVKFHRLLSEGLAQDGVSSVNALVTLHYDCSNYPFNVGEFSEVENGVHYYYCKESSFLSVYSFYCKKIEELSVGKEETIIICDILNATSSLAALRMSAKLKIKCLGIVTDLPNFVIEKKSLRSRLGSRLTGQLQKRFDGYVLLTEDMNEVVNPAHKPYTISECVVDSRFQPSKSGGAKKKKCIYAGGIERQYGLPELIEGFIQADLPDVELDLFGAGGYVKELQIDELKKHNIIYRGVLANEKVVEEEKEASLLINPRSPLEEFTKYSFPSKNMEYMSTGTPMLGFKLPGIPKGYFDYMFTMEEFSSSSIAIALKTVFSLSETERASKGEKAQKFVLENKNNVVMAKRILQLADACPPKR